MNVDPTSAAPSAGRASPGAAIRSARTRAGLSIEELASRTRLSRQTLEALEADAFDQLLEPVYVRGYYRKCAGILEISEQPLIEAYDALYAPAPKPAPARLQLASGGDLGSSPRFATKLAVLAPLAAVAIIAALWMLRQAPPSADSTLTLVDPTLPDGAIAPSTIAPAEAPGDAAAPAPAPVESAPEPPSPAPEPEAAGVEPADAALAAATAPDEATAPAPAPPATPAPVGTQLVLQFDAISWARVEDASGRSLLSGVISAGETRTLDGRPPYSIFLGNAPGVRLTFGGLPVDVKPFVKSNATARFSVPAAGN